MCQNYKYMLQIKPEYDDKFKKTGKHTQMIYLCEVKDVKRGLVKLDYDKKRFNLLVKECGKCHICRFKRASIKACQAQCEAKTYNNNCSFVTLTFGEKQMTDYIMKDNRYSKLSVYKKKKYINFLQWSLEKREITLFIKRLRFHFEQQQIKQFIRKHCLWHLLYKKNGQEYKRLFLPKCYDFTPTKIRFLLAGEYGEFKFRPHYHLIVYGVNFGFDRSQLRYSWKLRRNKLVHFNNVLSRLWKFGDATTDKVTYQSCNYVARYITKKTVNHNKTMVNNDIAGYMYNGRLPEYCRQSNRPGLGKQYFLDNMDKICKDNALYFRNIKGEFKSVPLPNYFKELMFRYNKSEYKRIQKESYLQQLEFSNKSVDELYSRMTKDDDFYKNLLNQFRGDFDSSGISVDKIRYLTTESKKLVFDDIKNYKDLLLRSYSDTGFVNDNETTRIKCYKNFEKYRKHLYKTALYEYISNRTNYPYRLGEFQKLLSKRMCIDLLENPFTKKNLDSYKCENGDILEKWKDYEVCYDKN